MLVDELHKFCQRLFLKGKAFAGTVSLNWELLIKIGAYKKFCLFVIPDGCYETPFFV